MTQKLSNAGLLDGDVAKNMNPTFINHNRVERLQRTTQFAENPEQAMEEPEEEETHNFNYSEPKPEVEEEKPSTAQIDRFSVPYSEPKKEEGSDDKIFGMNKWVVLGAAAVVVAVGGYFVYNKFFKKGSIAAVAAGVPSVAAPSAAAPVAPVIK